MLSVTDRSAAIGTEYRKLLFSSTWMKFSCGHSEPLLSSGHIERHKFWPQVLVVLLILGQTVCGYGQVMRIFWQSSSFFFHSRSSPVGVGCGSVSILLLARCLVSRCCLRVQFSLLLLFQWSVRRQVQGLFVFQLLVLWLVQRCEYAELVTWCSEDFMDV